MKKCYIKSLILLVQLINFILRRKSSRLNSILSKYFSGFTEVIKISTRDGLKWEIPIASYVDCKIAMETLELPILRFISEQNLSGAYVVDMGANVGGVTVRLAKAVGSSGKVIAYEPNPVIAERLRKNLLLNSFNQVEIIQMGVWSEPGSFELHLPHHHNAGTASILDKESNINGTVVEIDVEAFDFRWKQLECPNIKLVKMDIQGAEKEALKGMSHMLNKCKPNVIIEVCGESKRFDQRISDLAFFFETMGYSKMTLLGYHTDKDLTITIDKAKDRSLDIFSGDVCFVA
ncbi:MAG: FkbM family methyltransferase [Opitutales bacterium]|nr:FkbM family methyltransferase [Opitutales bacterium]